MCDVSCTVFMLNHGEYIIVFDMTLFYKFPLTFAMMAKGDNSDDVDSWFYVTY